MSLVIFSFIHFSQGSPESPSFFVVLGPAVDLPVVLKDVHPSKTPALRSLDTILNNAPGGVPGRFYKGENAAAIVNSFGLEGSSARIVLNCTATEVQKQNFERFRSLLKAGAIVSTPLICCSDTMLIAGYVVCRHGWPTPPRLFFL